MAIEHTSGRRLDEMFDYISGTSTGGMLALGLLKGLTSRDIQRFYLKLKDECFHVSLAPLRVNQVLESNALSRENDHILTFHLKPT